MSRTTSITLLTGLAATLCVAVLASPLAAQRAPSAEALQLRNLGLAQLENEKPEEAEETFRRIARLVPRDPLGPANLAIALHRQQKTDGALAMIAAARELAPDRADLVAIEAEIHGWGTGDADKALELYRQAMRLAPTDPEIVYAVYRQADATLSDDAKEIGDEALQQLALLRPDNLVVLLRSGVNAIEREDRAAATAAWLRIRELIWQPQGRLAELAQGELQKLLDALEAGEVAQANVPARRLENLLKSQPVFKSSLVEIFTDVRGLPVWRFQSEPTSPFGDGIDVTFEASVLDAIPSVAAAQQVGRFGALDEDDQVARIGGSPDGRNVLEIHSTAEKRLVGRVGSRDQLLAVDLDNSGRLDLIAYGGNQAPIVWLAQGESAWAAADNALGLADLRPLALAAIDFDSEGDLDLVALDQQNNLTFHRNNLQDDLVAVPFQSFIGDAAPDIFPALAAKYRGQLFVADLDRDEDHDLLALGGSGDAVGGAAWLDNLRQGQFRDRTTNGGLARVNGVSSPHGAIGDLDNDGQLDLALATGDTVTLLRNRGGAFGSWRGAAPAPDVGSVRQVRMFDADNDGQLDLGVAGADGVAVLLQRDGSWEEATSLGAVDTNGDGQLDLVTTSNGKTTALVRRDGTWTATALERKPPVARGEDRSAPWTAIDPLDLDGDGDLDLVASGPAGLVQLLNEGGNKNGWLSLQLQGLTKGNDKNNYFGRGAFVEVRVGGAYQYREVSEQTTHFGLGRNRRADNVRVLWNNGVPQNRLQPQGNQRIVEEQVLKGSCPFVYTWDGERISFVTDLLWNAPLGMPVAPGIYAASDPRELVRLDGAVPRRLEGEDGTARDVIDLRITEELWEAAYFDRARLWVVDHPADSELTSSLRVFARIPEAFRFDEPRIIEGVRPISQAWDGRQRDVTARVASRDDVYADGYPIGDYQGVAAEPWAVSFDLGEAPAAPIRLVLDGWIFPADASLNLAVAQRDDLRHHPLTALEGQLPDGSWATVLDPMGFPAGKTKTMVVDTPALPAGMSRLRIRTSRWLHWDRIAWTPELASDDTAMVQARMLPTSADLRYRGFSKLERQAPNAPHEYDYSQVEPASPWLPAGGLYTKYGDVMPLLEEIDDRLIVMGPGDEIALAYDVTDLVPPAAGMQRSYLLESFGWDKDFDRNTWEATSSQPLPFGAMQGYPYDPEGAAPGSGYPDTPELQSYRERWLTRTFDSEAPAPPSANPSSAGSP